jgi:hypothetical protein
MVSFRHSRDAGKHHPRMPTMLELRFRKKAVDQTLCFLAATSVFAGTAWIASIDRFIDLPTKGRIILCTLGHRVRFCPMEYREPFRSSTWKHNVSEYYSGDNIDMLDDFLARYKLVGMSRHEIQGLLGDFDETSKTIDHQRILKVGCFIFHHGELEIEYDARHEKNRAAQKALRYRVKVDFDCMNDSFMSPELTTPWYY